MALHLGLVSTSTSLSFLTTSLKKTYWGRSDAARSYDAQRPVLLHAPVAWAAVWAGGGLAVDSLPLHVAGRHPVVDNLRHAGVRVRGGPAVAPAAAWTQQQEKVSLFPNIIVLTGPSGVCPDQLGKGLRYRLSVYVGGETGGTRLLPEPGADPEMQELGHPCEAPRHEAEQLKVDDGLAVLQKTLVNTGYSGHTLTLTLPAPMKKLKLLRVSSCSMTALLQPLSRTILWISVFNKSMDWRKPHYSQQTSAWTQPLST